ncbi:MAG TPA: AraC family transcriptional regulator [Lysobacter sp.]|nr:AraC family transcriptional regulator [Lysobacter sp.]
MVDRLQALLQRFSVSARMFHSGPLCGIHDFAEIPGCGQLHLVRRGPVEARHGTHAPVQIEVPSVIFYPRPLAHRFITDARVGADMVCANISLSAGADNPITRALPSVVVLPLADVRSAEPALDLLFEEAFAQRCGRQQLIDRLFEAVLILILRALIDRGGMDQGLMAGLAHPQLAKALVAMHETPAHAWSLEQLATCAGMSRSHFAAVFAQTVGITAGEYLARHRIALAQDLMSRGVPLKRVVDEVGYGSSAALSRAFRAICGQSPRAWKEALGASIIAR